MERLKDVVTNYYWPSSETFINDNGHCLLFFNKRVGGPAKIVLLPAYTKDVKILTFGEFALILAFKNGSMRASLFFGGKRRGVKSVSEADTGTIFLAGNGFQMTVRRGSDDDILIELNGTLPNAICKNEHGVKKKKYYSRMGRLQHSFLLVRRDKV